MAKTNSPPPIIFHSLADALAAVAAAEKLTCPLVLMSAPGAAGYAGVTWFLAIIDHIKKRTPPIKDEVKTGTDRHTIILDCGGDAGVALGAIRAGVQHIRLEAPPTVRRKIAAIADERGVTLLVPPSSRSPNDAKEGAKLDLQFSTDPQGACLAWLLRHHPPLGNRDGAGHNDSAKPAMLYAITPPSIEPTCFAGVLDTALKASGEASSRVGCLQLRLKPTHPRAVRAAVDALRPVCHEHRIALVINDNPRLAAAVPCEGVHVGRDDPPCDQARICIGAEKILGVSCYDSLSLARQACKAGADYVAFGAFFPSRTKPDQDIRASVATLARWTRDSAVPAAVIGGITPDNALPLIEAGARYLCASAVLWTHPQGAGAAICAFARAMDRGEKARKKMI